MLLCGADDRLLSSANLDAYTGIPYTWAVKVRVFATSRYEKEVRRLLTELEQAALQRAIAADPEAGSWRV
jgi:hypothetical protein